MKSGSSADIAAAEDATIAGAGLGCDRHGACDVALDTIPDGAAEAVLARGPVAPTPQSRAYRLWVAIVTVPVMWLWT